MTSSAARAFVVVDAMSIAPNSAVRERNFTKAALLDNFIPLAMRDDRVAMAAPRNISQKSNMSMRQCD